MQRVLVGLVFLLAAFSIAATESGHRHLGATRDNFPANVTEIIRSYGYPAEDYSVTTSDGFVLSITRIPYGVKV